MIKYGEKFAPKCLKLHVTSPSLTHKTSNTCAPVTWYTQIISHAHVGFTQIDKCKLCSSPSVKLGLLGFNCVPVSICFVLFVYSFYLFQIKGTLMLPARFLKDKIIRFMKLNLINCLLMISIYTGLDLCICKIVLCVQIDSYFCVV